MSEAKRILHIMGIMNTGGAETFIMNIYRRIDKSKIQFDFVVHSRDKGHYDDEIRSLGGRIFYLPRFRGINLVQYIIEWIKLLKSHPEFNVIHSHIRSTASILLYIAKLSGRRTIIHSHSTSSGIGVEARVKDALQYPLRFIADEFFACSREAGLWLFGGKRNVQVLNNGVDTSRFKYDREKRIDIRKGLGLKDELLIGHVGRFNYPKNHMFILEIFKECYELNLNTRLMLVGDGVLKKQIENRAKELGIEKNIFFMGIRKDVSDLMSAMDCFIMPSHYEGIPVSLIEAQTSGLMCIASNAIDRRIDICNNMTFLSIEDAKAWAGYINSVKKDYIRNGKEHIVKTRGFDIGDIADNLINHYLSNLEY